MDRTHLSLDEEGKKIKREGFTCEEPPDGLLWPPKSYTCSFCEWRFRSAQALGGHANVRRRERTRLKQLSSWVFECPPPPPNPNRNIVVTSSSQSSHSQSRLNPTLLPPLTPSSPSGNKCFSCASTPSLSSDLDHGQRKKLVVLAADDGRPCGFSRQASNNLGKKQSGRSTGVAGVEEEEAKAILEKDKLVQVHGDLSRLELEIGLIKDPSCSLNLEF